MEPQTPAASCPGQPGRGKSNLGVSPRPIFSPPRPGLASVGLGF